MTQNNQILKNHGFQCPVLKIGKWHRGMVISTILSSQSETNHENSCTTSKASHNFSFEYILYGLIILFQWSDSRVTVGNLDDSDQKLKLYLGNCFLTTVQLSKIENRDFSKSDYFESPILDSSSVLQISTHGLIAVAF